MENKFPGFFEGTRFYSSIGMNNLMRPLPTDAPRETPLAGYHVYLAAHDPTSQMETGIKLQDFALTFARLSAMAWRRYNGPIRLITDPEGAMYFRSVGLAEIYDEVLPVLSTRNHGIDVRRYWASGKIQAMEYITPPFVLIDMDLAVWQPLEVGDAVLAVAHTEPVYESAYPPFSFFRMSRSYHFPEEWMEETLPLNTSILYMNDETLKTDYVRESIRFMQSDVNTPDDGIRCMVFAEQRILGMCAAAKGIVPRTYLDYRAPLADQQLITHLWAGKRLLLQDETLKTQFLELCEDKIASLTRYS